MTIARGVRKIAVWSAACLLLLQTGCATNGAEHPQDPYEGFNRAMFQVNEGVDVVTKPIAQAYDAVAPTPVRAGIGNFFSNLGDIWISVNSFLQGKGGQGASDLGRVLINSTLGIGGVFDIASEMGLEKHTEDFGQTLAVWGVQEGPYLFLPMTGPRTTRDAFGWAVDIYADPVWYFEPVALRNSLAGTRFINVRAGFLPVDKIIEEAAFDRYSYIRDAYLQNRRSAVQE